MYPDAIASKTGIQRFNVAVVFPSKFKDLVLLPMYESKSLYQSGITFDAGIGGSKSICVLFINLILIFCPLKIYFKFIRFQPIPIKIHSKSIPCRPLGMQLVGRKRKSLDLKPKNQMVWVQ